ncbi:MAG TPA: S8 family serine peptidase [Solirubrobacteraceae bacterium]|jgi:hypothetical protein
MGGHGRRSWRGAHRRLGVLALLLGATVLAFQLAAGHGGRVSAGVAASASAGTGTLAGAGTLTAASAGSPSTRPLPQAGASAASGGEAARFNAGIVLLGFRPGVSAASRRAIERAVGASAEKRLGPALRPVSTHSSVPALPTPLELRVPGGGVLAAVERLRRFHQVAYAEPDYVMHASAAPNDPSFGVQWGDSNTGQAIPTQEGNEVLGAPANGTAGADDSALKAWGTTTGSTSIVIGETDTGVDYAHPDLAANVWSNPGGIGGCASGTHGYSVVSHTCNPMDDDTVYGGHGTHVAGIMGAVGNNGVGVSGMNWRTTILPVKWLNASAWGETSGLIEALQWLIAAKQAGVNVRVVNDSATFAGTAFSQALSNEIDTLGANGILFVTAAGNSGNNNDEEKVRRYPCGYDRPTEICVTATDNNDQLPSWANYGPHTVDLAAPGVSIYSTLREGKYGYLSGGSMASPQVAGAAALILAVSPSFTPQELKADIVGNVDPLPSLAGKVISGGRLDVCKALPGCSGPPPPPPPATFGKTSIGASSDTYAASRKRVNRYALPVAGSVTKLSTYLAPTSTTGQQVLKGVIYADNGGAPGALLGVSQQLTFLSSNAAGWYDMVFSSPITLAAGNYWIGLITGSTAGVAGFRYTSVAGSRDFNTNSYPSGPSNPFGAASTDGEQPSLYATYTPTGTQPVPVNTAVPTISGTPQEGKTLSETHGSWTNEPTGYTYRWQRCDSAGANCVAISGATAQTYTAVAEDVGHALRVQETASNAGGSGSAATSGATSAVTAAAPPPAPPSSTAPPTIKGTPQQGQTLSEAHGSWTGEPTSYTYLWSQCDSSGNNCAAISTATSQSYVPVAADVGRTLRVQETASNGAGAGAPASSGASAVVTPPAPVSSAAPTISGTAEQGMTLTEHAGSWTNNPTGLTYQWLQCDSLGNGCLPISGATSQTYVPVPGDVGHALRVQETASNEGGASAPASSAATAKVVPPPPANSSPPTIAGSAQPGQTLTAGTGSWANEPTSFAYLWNRCDATGANCASIATATASTYTVAAADAGSTLRVAVTASNAGGSSSPASSAQTAVVGAATATFGKTTVGASSDTFLADRKRVNRYSLPTAGSVTKLSIYLAHAASSGQQLLKGVIYGDSAGAPGALLAVSEPITFTSTSANGWYDMTFSSPVGLAAGNYWIGIITGATSGVAGFRYDSVSAARDYNANTYTSGPSNPFGSPSTDSEQASLYATYTTATDTTPPTQPSGLSATAAGATQINLSWTASSDNVGIAGYTIRRGGTVIANTGTAATSYSDTELSPATGYSYTVDAYDAAGNHSPQSTAAQAATLSSSAVAHYEYVFPANAIDVYDLDNGDRLVRTVSLPQATDIRGAAASPATHMLYVSYGGDGGENGGGSMLAYDLLANEVVWTHSYPEGVDSMALSPDGRTIYLPVGEASSASTWNVVEAATGNILRTISGGAAPHNTIVSLNGEHVYMGGRNSSYLTVANTSTDQITKQIGPLLNGGVRPFTINGKETLAFTTATGFLGFQVSSITTGQVLYTVPITGNFPYTAGQAGPSSPSHGISLSPNEKELWVMDQPNDYVHVFDVSGLPTSAPKQIADIKLTRAMTGSQVGCTYDCLREGWLQHSLDGRYVVVGDSGDIIDTATRTSVANLEPLYNSRVFLEVDWSNGVPVATSTRSGVGYVTK